MYFRICAIIVHSGFAAKRPKKRSLVLRGFSGERDGEATFRVDHWDPQ
jgi:hypothetical protein